MIGEMRDSETADIGIRAAITGHLVLSTLHTNDAASTIVRLIDMGVASYMVATSLIGVIAQRLVKVLCPKCKTQRFSNEDENKLMKLDDIYTPIPVFESQGCPECNNTGYRGRTAIHEIIHCTSGISTLIAESAGKEQLEEAAKRNGTKLLRDNVAELVQQGRTTIDELVRVTYSV
jgi:type IV pilus assembly protein PilB